MAISASYEHGVRRGLDTRITYGFTDDAWAMSVAFSRLLFGLHEGYIGYKAVSDTASAVLEPDGVNKPSSIPLLQSRDAIQRAFDAVRRIDSATLPKYIGMDKDFVSIYYNDVGLSDFYTLAFLTFGYEANAMYKFYFVIMALSLAVFCLEYRRQAQPLATLALVCCTFPILLFSDFFNDLMPSVNASRFMSTLGFIPILHVAWTLRHRCRYDGWRLVRLLIQALLFAFAVSIRKTAEWQLMWFIVLMGMVAWPVWRSQAKRFSGATMLKLFYYLPLRGGLLFIALFFVYFQVQSMNLNPIYFSDCAIPYHVTWHTVFVSLSEHPEWKNFNTLAPEGEAGSDRLGWSALEKYFHGDTKKFICHGLYKIGLHERVMRELVFRFALQHPLYVLELFFYYKPMHAIENLKDFEGVATFFWWWCIGLGISAGLCTALMAGRSDRDIPYYYAALGCIGFLISFLPSMLGLSQRFMPDIVWLIAINGCLLIWLATAWLCACCLKLSWRTLRKI